MCYRALLCAKKTQKGTGVSSKDLADLQEKRNSLARRIKAWRLNQLIHMPGVSNLTLPSASLHDDDDIPVENAEDVPLYLPSSAPDDLRTRPQWAPLIRTEIRLRLAQAEDSLAELRRQLRTSHALPTYKKQQVVGQGPNTRARAIFSRFSAKTDRCSDRYCRAYEALQILDPNGSWTQRLQKLNKEDVRGPGREEDEPSEGRRVTSWIWRVGLGSSNVELTEEELHETVRVEWARSKARADRWREEVILLEEEMRRVLAYLNWKACWWEQRGVLREDLDPVLTSGIKTYALKQAAMLGRLATSFANKWYLLFIKTGIIPSWVSCYTIVPPRRAHKSKSYNSGVPGRPKDLPVMDERMSDDGEDSDDEGQ